MSQTDPPHEGQRGAAVSTVFEASRSRGAHRLRSPRSAQRSLAPVALALLLLLGATACVPVKVPPEKAIVGQWVNAGGGTIYFYEDGTGFIPGLSGVEGQSLAIPAAAFTYYFEDDTHLGIALEGQDAIIVEVKLEGDKMTWSNPYNDTEYVYTRVKEASGPAQLERRSSIAWQPCLAVRNRSSQREANLSPG